MWIVGWGQRLSFTRFWSKETFWYVEADEETEKESVQLRNIYLNQIWQHKEYYKSNWNTTKHLLKVVQTPVNKKY